MKTYKIIGETNGYIASRNIEFNGKTRIEIETGLSIEDAIEQLDVLFKERYDYSHDECIELYNEDTDEITYCTDNRWTDYQDGTASFEYDSRYYRIEEEEEN